MALEKVTAFVTRKIQFKDSDYVVTLLGRESGRFAGIAKGARKQKSKFGGVFDLLNLVEVVFYQRSGLEFISEAELVQNWEGVKKSGESINSGLRCARAINKLLEDGQQERKVYDLMKDTLSSLDEEQPRPRVVELAFYLKLFQSLGYQPRLNKCSNCGKLVEDDNSVKFSPEKGGIVCPNCSSGREFTISAGLRKVLIKISSSPQSAVRRLRVTENQLQEGFALLNKFGRFHFDQELIPDRARSPNFCG